TDPVARTGAVMKAPLAGTAGGPPTTLASGQDGPHGIAVDGSNVYWTNQGDGFDPDGSVMKVPLAGGTPTTLASGLTSPWEIALDATSAYWTSNSQGTVMKVPLGGGTPTTLATAQAVAGGIAVVGTSVYWGSYEDYTPADTYGTIVKVPSSGGAITTLSSSLQDFPTEIAVNATNVFWTNDDTNGGVKTVASE
ncbi:MAG TPA: hypothetical protein VIY73_06625, partial [Polyangiaceae bacterium]